MHPRICHHRDRPMCHGFAGGLTLLGLSLGLMTANAQTDQNIPQELVSQLDVLAISLETEGYGEYLSQADNVGLRTGEAQFWDVTITTEDNYLIAAVCDQDCSNIDLELWADDTLITQDTAEDSYPRVTANLKPGTYRVFIVMQDCSIEPCYSAFRVFLQE